MQSSRVCFRDMHPDNKHHSTLHFTYVWPENALSVEGVIGKINTIFMLNHVVRAMKSPQITRERIIGVYLLIHTIRSLVNGDWS